MTDECFADEIAIDFPSVGGVVARMRESFLGEQADADVLHAEVSLSQSEALAGHIVSLEVPVRATCPNCGGRGESWTERCQLCRGTGESWFSHPVSVPLPPRVADGARLRFRLRSPDASPVRVELRVAVRSSAA
jgi:predicted RNA-binding Zn-ribbon protein involved in translation (DUF1610 family)